MSTKVKGEAIKEGSIPLSALSDEVKDKIENAVGGADWNAQKGEAGYIENKPFGYADTHYKKFDFDGTAGEFDAGYIENYYYDKLHIVTDGDIDTDIRISDIMGIENAKVLSGPVSIYVNNEHHLIIKSIGIYYAFKITFSAYSNIKAIGDKYLPNTVLKTTPQTLSDTDKNQALANLGIDPVVWKYICKPYIFNSSEFNMQIPIPSELMQNGKLKYKIPAMYRININNQYFNQDGERIDFTEINNQYGEYTPTGVSDNSIQTVNLNNDYSLSINISATGKWDINVSV